MQSKSCADFMRKIDTLGNSEISIIAFRKDPIASFDFENIPSARMLALMHLFCDERLKFITFWKEVRKMYEEEAKQPHDDNDCSGFDQMDHQNYWESFHKRACRDARKAIVDWYEINIMNLHRAPKTETELEQHNDSECESDCDDCKRRDVFRVARKQKGASNNHSQELKRLLDSAQPGNVFTLQKCFHYSVDGYIRDGMTIDDKFITIRFVKNHNMSGILWNVTKTECWIHFVDECFSKSDGSIELCPYEFTKRHIQGTISPDSSQADSVRILYQDDIFEDWVHKSRGFIIPNEQIDKHLKAKANANAGKRRKQWKLVPLID
jgi:rubrerythrin